MDNPTGCLQGRVCLITGASRGIGAAVAKAYASEGAHVLIAARTVGGLEEVDDFIQKDRNAQQYGGKATIIPIDVGDPGMLDQLALQIASRFERLDVFIGNAATLGQLAPITHTVDKVWQEVMRINLEANFRLLRALDPLLKKSDAGRVIMVTSGVVPERREQPVHPYWGAYAISKAALEMMLRIYASETVETTVKSALIDPGVVHTKMRAKAFPGEDVNELPEPEYVVGPFVEVAKADYEAKDLLLKVM